MNYLADFRSDTVTRPGAAMREAIRAAEVGDVVMGDDPTVHLLEERLAELLQKQAGLFVPSGTQSNLCGLLSHCQRGDEYIAGETAHIFRYEAGGAAVLGSIQPQPVRVLEGGQIDLEHVRSVIKPDDPHFARTKLLCLENTTDGDVLPLNYQAECIALAEEFSLASHLDGARIWNAAAALSVPVAELAKGFDTVSVCLSKGLGAPVGSVLVGPAEQISEARRWCKMLGGAMRQAGLLAAAGLYAVDNHQVRVSEDHKNAARLAEGLAGIDGVEVTKHATNMVFVNFNFLEKSNSASFADYLKQNKICIRMNGVSSRMVTHLDISADGIDQTVELIASY